MQKATVPPNCAACGEEFPKKYTGSTELLYALISLGPTREAHVCAAKRRRTYYYKGYGYEHGPSEKCALKLRTKLGVCPGCGEENHTEPGTICQKCEQTMERVRQAGDVPVRWYSLSSSKSLTMSYLSPDDEGAETAKKLVKLMAAMAKASRRMQTNYPSEVTFGMSLIAAKPSNWDRSSSGDIYVEMDESQASAMQEFCALLGQFVDESQRRGYEEGDNVLRRLANGDLTPLDFEQQRMNRLPKNKG